MPKLRAASRLSRENKRISWVSEKNSTWVVAKLSSKLSRCRAFDKLSLQNQNWGWWRQLLCSSNLIPIIFGGHLESYIAAFRKYHGRFCWGRSARFCRWRVMWNPWYMWRISIEEFPEFHGYSGKIRAKESKRRLATINWQSVIRVLSNCTSWVSDTIEICASRCMLKGTDRECDVKSIFRKSTIRFENSDDGAAITISVWSISVFSRLEWMRDTEREAER